VECEVRLHASPSFRTHNHLLQANHSGQRNSKTQSRIFDQGPSNASPASTRCARCRKRRRCISSSSRLDGVWCFLEFSTRVLRRLVLRAACICKRRVGPACRCARHVWDCATQGWRRASVLLGERGEYGLHGLAASKYSNVVERICCQGSVVRRATPHRGFGKSG
jgi:hypothetical protein